MMDRELACRVFACIDNTTLSTADTETSVMAFCHKTRSMTMAVAGVCVYPRFVPTAAAVLKGSGIRVVSVASDFPHGQASIATKLEDVRTLVSAGADEVDVVINRGLVLAGRYDEAVEEIRQQKIIMEGRTLKVILETCELPTKELIEVASQIAIDGGADFIKTSTGKGSAGATLEAAGIMLNCIKENVKKGKKTVGFKAAGGIRKPEEALRYAELAMQIMGVEYIVPQIFRIGASSLTESMYSLLTK
jgi:deoxyribose-phosphate aldolase